MTGPEIAQIIKELAVLLATIAGLIVSIRNGRRIREVKQAANGLASALATVSELKGHAEGKQEERGEERERVELKLSVPGNAATNQTTEK